MSRARPARAGAAVPARKLQAPLRMPHLLPRVRLARDLQALRRAKLVLIRAPAGFGKTTAMLQLREAMSAEGVRSVWLTLDDLDNNAERFAGFVSSAFAQAMLPGDAGGGAGNASMALLDRLSGHDQPFALFLDDFEAIHDAAVLAIVREIVDSLPPGGQLVIASRASPELGLARLRALGQLFEIEAEQLRFSQEEVTQYLVEQCGLKLEAADLKRLYRATEGWATALALVSVSLARRDDPRPFIAEFSGSNADLVDYLGEDVLSGLAEPLRLFLLETCVLSELSAPLCDRLRGRSDSAALLAELERAQLFLIPLDSQRQLYRYHRLFAEFLREQLRRSLPQRVAPLHRAASQWYLEQQRPIAAIEHALAGDDAPAAVALLSQFASTILHNGRARLLARWLGRIDPALLADQPELRAIELWALFFAQEPEQALTRLDALEAGFGPSHRPAAIVADLLALRPLLLQRMDRFDEAFDIGLRHWPLLAAHRKTFSFSILASSMATMQIGQDHEAVVKRLLDEAAEAGPGQANPVGTLYAACCEGIVDLMQARLRQAAARFRFAEQSLAPARSVDELSGNAAAGVLHAVVLYELNDWEAAERRLRVHLPAVKDQGFPDQVIVGSLALARIVFHRGDVDGAWALLTELEYLGRRAHWPRALAVARLERSRLLLLRGDLAAAQRELEHADVPMLWPRVERFSLLANDLDTLAIARLRCMLHAGEAARAVPELTQARTQALQAQRYRRALLLTLLLALGLQASGQTAAALIETHRALRESSSEGFVRLFVDEGDRAATLIQQLAAASAEHGVGKATRQHLDKLLLAFGQSREESGQALALSGAGMAEALTRKEFQVLRLLAEGLSNDAMAARLFVSETTVRTHLRNISAKLGAANRTQAVTIARRLGLVA